MTDKRVYRSTAARVGGWAWLVFAAANMIDIAVRGRDSAALIAAAALLLGCGSAYVLGLRPRVVADETGVRVHNPLRDVVIPWQAVEKITAPDSIRITYTGLDGESHETRSWVLQTSPRERAKAERRAARGPDDKIARYLKNRTPADFAAEQLTELADTYRRTGSTSTGTRSTGTIPARPASAGAKPAGADLAGAEHGGTGGVGSQEPPTGQANWSASATAALVGPALLLAGIILAVTLR